MPRLTEIEKEVEEALKDRGADETERKIIDAFQRLFVAMEKELVGDGNTTTALQMSRPEDPHDTCKMFGRCMLSFRHPAGEYAEYLTRVSLKVKGFVAHSAIAFRLYPRTEKGWHLLKDEQMGTPSKRQPPWEWSDGEFRANANTILDSLSEDLKRQASAFF